MAHTIFSYPYVIREGQLDTYGHVNNAAYLQIFEEARWEICARRGFGVEDVRLTRVGPVVLEIHIRFLKELKLRMKIDVKSQLVSYSRKVFKLRQWMEDEAGESRCETEFVMGLFDLTARKLILPTPEWLATIGADEALLG